MNDQLSQTDVTYSPDHIELAGHIFRVGSEQGTFFESTTVVFVYKVSPAANEIAAVTIDGRSQICDLRWMHVKCNIGCRVNQHL